MKSNLVELLAELQSNFIIKVSYTARRALLSFLNLVELWSKCSSDPTILKNHNGLQLSSQNKHRPLHRDPTTESWFSFFCPDKRKKP